MNNNEPLPVKSAYLQAPITIEGVMSSQTRLDKKMFPKLVMLLTDKGLMIQHDNIHAFIPSTNVKIAVLE